MRRLRRSVLIVVLALSATMLWQHYANTTFFSLTKGQQSDFLKSQISACYILPETSWISFTLSGSNQPVKIISNAAISHSSEIPSDLRVHYAIRWQLIDNQGEIITTQLYHHRSGFNLFQSDKKIFTKQFFLDQSSYIASGTRLILELTKYRKVKQIQIQLVKTDPIIDKVVFRIYQNEVIPDYKQSLKWERTSLKQKIKLAESNVYELPFLRPQEKLDLIKNRWEPLRPVGISGQDYSPDTLYTLTEHEGISLKEPIQTSGFYIGPDHFMTLRLPEQTSQYALEFEPINVDKILSPLTINWYEQGSQNTKQFLFMPSQINLRWQQPLAGGLLEIKSPFPLISNLFQLTNEWQKIDIKPARIRAYYLNTEKGVSYGIEHIKNQLIPFRFDLRTIISQSKDFEKSAQIHYEWLNHKEQILKKGTLHLPVQPFPYDRILYNTPELQISDAIKHYVQFSRKIKSVRFFSSEPILINAYTRLPELPLEHQIPEDYFGDFSRNTTIPRWFLTKPMSKNKTTLTHIPQVKKSL